MRRVALTLAVTWAAVAAAAATVPAAASTARSSSGGRVTASSPSPSQIRALRSASEAKAALDRKGAVTGMVLRPGGAPAAGVCVQARGLLTTRTAFTMPDGRFIIGGLPLGSYRIEYRGCSPIANWVAQWYGGLTRASAATVQVPGTMPVSLAPVTLSMISPRFERRASAASQPRPAFPGIVGQVAALVGQPAGGAGAPPPRPPGASHITGRVTNSSGHALSGVCVFAERTVHHTLLIFGARVSLKSGGYSLRLFEPGTYVVAFLPACGQKGNYAPQLWKGAGSLAKATPIKVRRGQTVRNINAVLGVGAQITGKITVSGAHHPPLGGVCVGAVGTAGQRPFASLATTKADGTFTLRSLATGKYRLAFALNCRKPSPYLPQTLSKLVQVTNGKTTAGISATLTVGGSITGTVKDTHGNPLAGICANAMTGRHFYNAATGSNGTYRVQGLPTGSYRMNFSPGCRNRGPYSPLTLPGKVAVTAGKTTPGVDAVLQTDGSITGVVTNAHGAPISGICVAVQGQSFGFATTNASGAYTVQKLPAGGYQVQFIPGGAFSNCGSHGNYLPANASATVTSATATTLNQVLPTGGMISGVVRDKRGNPISGICVVSNGRSPFARQIVTKSDGSYRLPQLFTGDYFVGFEGGCGNTGSVAPVAYRGDPTFFAPTSIPVTQGKVTTGIDAKMRPGGVLAGQVTDQAGRLLSNICVTIFATAGAGAGQFAAFEISHHGTYSISNLPPGQYSVLFSGLFARHRGCMRSPYADQQFKGHGPGTAGDQVAVPGGRVTKGVNATLQPAGTISGVIRNAAGKSLPGTCVTATDPATKAQSFSGSVRQGKYQLIDLPAGRYLVQFGNCGGGGFFFGGSQNYASQWYKNSPTKAKATPVVVTGGKTTPNIDAALTRGATITGHVSFKRTGRPISLVCVFAFTPNVSAFGTGLTDRRGNYSIAGLSTGHYIVEFLPCSFESALAAQIRPGRVSVVAGRTVRGVSISMRIGGSVSGAISYMAGSKTKPAPGTCVDVLPLSKTGVGAVSFATNGGSYLATNLLPGQYQVLFGDPLCSSSSPTLSASLSTVIKVASRKTTSGVNATLSLTGGIAGTVRGPRGGISGICAMAVPAHLTTPGLARVTTVGISGSGGSYRIPGLQPGTYRVEFTSDCGAVGYATRWYRNAASKRTATLVKVAPATVTGNINTTLPRG